MISKAICLCVDRRIHFTDLIVRQFKELGIPLQLFIAGQGKILDQYDHIDTDQVPSSWQYAGGQPRINNYNAFLCHQKMITIAKEEGLQNVLLLEDDAIILTRFKNLISIILEQLKDTNWDTCYLGYHLQPHVQHVVKQQEQQYQQDKRAYTIKEREIGGFHGVLVNHTGFDKLLAIPPVTNMDIVCPKHTTTYYSVPRLIYFRNIPSAALMEHPDARFSIYEQELIKDIDYEFPN